MLDDTTDRASFSAMVDGTADDYAKISAAFGEFSKTLPDRVMAHLQMLQGDFGGFAVDRFEHSLQTATRAFKDGKDEEYVVCALLHDIGDLLGTFQPCRTGRGDPEAVHFRAEPFHAAESRYFPGLLFLPPYRA